MGTLRRLEELAADGRRVSVAVAGAGFIGRGVLRQVDITPGLVPALVVNRSAQRGVQAWQLAGRPEADILVSDDLDEIGEAVAEARPVVSTSPEALFELPAIDLVVEATGAMSYGAHVVLGALGAGKDVVSMNAELDATIGYLLHDEARKAGTVYTIADGDQPGVLLRQLEFVAGLGVEIVAAVNCKRNLDVHQSPDDSRPYAERDGTSVLMTTAFGDGTKMQIENAVVANLTGLVPDVRGMHGVETTIERAAEDIGAAASRPGIVEYTLGGDFGGGVGVVGRSDDREIRHLLRYAKVGEGPDYFFFRPYHLMHLEVPITIGEVALDRRPVAAPSGGPVAEVVAIAKRDLEPGEALDGIGGFCCYGQVDTVERAGQLLPIGLAEHARVVSAVRRDDPVPLDAVELDESAELVRLRRRQDERVASAELAARGPSPTAR